MQVARLSSCATPLTPVNGVAEKRILLIIMTTKTRKTLLDSSMPLTFSSGGELLRIWDRPGRPGRPAEAHDSFRRPRGLAVRARSDTAAGPHGGRAGADGAKQQ